MKHMRSQRGIALPIVLLFIVVLVLLGFGLSVFGYYEATSAIREEHLAKAYYIARGSVAALANYVMNVPYDVTENEYEEFVTNLADFVEDIVDGTLTGSFTLGGGGSYDELDNFSITATKNDDPDNDPSTETGILVLTSTGTSGKFSRDASLQLTYTLMEYKPFGLVDCALFTEASANADENDPKNPPNYKVDIYGKVVTYGDPTDPNIGDYIDTNIHVDPKDALWPDILPELRNYRIPRELEFFGADMGAVTINSNVVWTNSNDKNTPTIYHCDSFTMNSGSLKFENPGMVYILIENGLTIKGRLGCSSVCTTGSVVTHENPDCWLGRVNIIYLGDQDISIGGNAYVRANIISLRADIGMDITTSGTPTLSGHIIAGTTGTISFMGNFENSPTMIYAPNAEVIVKGSASVPDFNGSIICNEFNPNSQFEVHYERIPRSSLPIWYGANATGFLDEEDNLGTGEYYVTNLVSDRWVN